MILYLSAMFGLSYLNVNVCHVLTYPLVIPFYSGLVGQLSEPRTDCPTTLADLPETPAHMYETQRRKPLNEHLEAQLLFFCIHNYPAEHANGTNL
jgi:hypothetical protein